MNNLRQMLNGTARQVVPSGIIRWVLRPPELAHELAPRTPGAPVWVLEALMVEVNRHGEPVRQAWVRVPMLTAEQAAEQDRAAGISEVGLVVVGGNG